MWIERVSLWSPPGRKSQEWTKENMSLTCSEGSLKVTIEENTLGCKRFDLRKGLTWTPSPPRRIISKPGPGRKI